MNLNGKRWKTPRRTTTMALLAAATAAACSENVTGPALVAPVFGWGNGAPSGEHYNLNIIGVKYAKDVDGTGSSGHRIFVWLTGQTKINLCQSQPLPEGVTSPCDDIVGFAVVDYNGTDNNGATFALPAPDADNDGVTTYSVYARALGTPLGSATNQTCGTEPISGETLCSEVILELTRSKGGVSKFTNVSKALLYVWADVDFDGDVDRVPLFDSRLENYFWEYTNTGLKLAQFRFYPCQTDVGATTTDPINDANCFE